jgi:hypothetical protein
MSFIICYTPYIYVIAIHALLNNKGVLQESGPIKFYRIGLRLIAKEDEWMTLKLSLVCQQKLHAEQGDQNGRIFAYIGPLLSTVHTSYVLILTKNQLGQILRDFLETHLVTLMQSCMRNARAGRKN